MVFGLFSRKSTLDDASNSARGEQRLPTPTPSIVSVNHPSPLRFSTVLRGALGRTTADSTDNSIPEAENNHSLPSSAPPPPETPTPPPPGDETKALYDLMLTIPPKTLHAYTLAHLRPPPSTSALGLLPETAPRPPSPYTASKLLAFFSTLTPPPLLHCVRCHKDYYDVENEEKDKACRVPHDDESTLVSRISGGGGYETHWGCCGQTTPGDGSEGPPDGWCYEGRHTTDVRRARFRNDSTKHDDKLTSCLKLNCHGIRDRLPRPDSPQASHRASPLGTGSVRRSNPSPTRSQASSRPARKRAPKSLRKVSGSESEGEDEVASSVGRGHIGKGKVDEPKSQARKPTSRPARPPHSTSTTASHTGPSARAAESNATATSASKASKSKTMSSKPKLTTSRTLVSQSHTHIASDSEASTRSMRLRARSCVRHDSRASIASGRDGSRTRAGAGSKPTPTKETADSGTRRRTRKAAFSEIHSSENEHNEEERSSDEEERGRERKKRRVRRD